MALNSFSDREPETSTAAPPRKPPKVPNYRTAMGGDDSGSGKSDSWYDPLNPYPTSSLLNNGDYPKRTRKENNEERMARYPFIPPTPKVPPRPNQVSLDRFLNPYKETNNNMLNPYKSEDPGSDYNK